MLISIWYIYFMIWISLLKLKQFHFSINEIKIINVFIIIRNTKNRIRATNILTELLSLVYFSIIRHLILLKSKLDASNNFGQSNYKS
jgi:hypothetical protein